MTMDQKSLIENLAEKSFCVGRSWTQVKFLCCLLRGRLKYIFLIIKSELDYIYKSITYVTKGTVDVSIFAKFKNASSA